VPPTAENLAVNDQVDSPRLPSTRSFPDLRARNKVRSGRPKILFAFRESPGVGQDFQPFTFLNQHESMYAAAASLC
jgi:hypothetical protein